MTFWKTFKIVFFVFASLALLVVLAVVALIVLGTVPMGVSEFQKARTKAIEAHAKTNAVSATNSPTPKAAHPTP